MAEDWLNTLKGVRAQSRDLAAGEMLARAGERADALFHVERGSLIFRRSSTVVHMAEAGSLAGEAALFADSHACDVVAQGATRVRLLPTRAVLLYLKAHPDLLLAFTAYLSRQVDAQRARLQLVLVRSAPERVLAWLAGFGDGWVEADKPLTAIARDLGLTHEAFYRTLAKLQKDGRIERRGTRGFRLT